MSKITSCNHDPDFTICTECQKVNLIAELQAKLDVATRNNSELVRIGHQRTDELEAAEKVIADVREACDDKCVTGDRYMLVRKIKSKLEFDNDLITEESKLEAVRGLLQMADCPQCNGDGAFHDGHGQVHQCQWCYERTAALGDKHD